MDLKVTELLKSNGLDAKGKGAEQGQNAGGQPPTETPEAKAAREEQERLSGGNNGNGDTGGSGDGGNAETPEAKEAREKLEREQQQQQQPDNDDLEEAQVIAYLKKKGKKVETLDDIDRPAPPVLTEEQEREAAQQKQDAVRKFALTAKKATSTDFDNYARESSLPVNDLAFNLYKKDRLEQLKTAKTPADQIPDDKALLEEFNEAHFLYADEDDPKRVRQEKILKKQVDEYIETKYANILDLEEEYDNSIVTTQQRNSYNSVIDSVMTDLGTEMDFEIIIDKDKDEKFPFKFKITPEVQTAIKQIYQSDNSFQLFGKSNVNKELLMEAVKGNIIQRELPRLLSEGAIAYASSVLDDKAKGRRGIPPNRREEGSEGGEKKVNQVVKNLLDNAENKKILQTTS